MEISEPELRRISEGPFDAKHIRKSARGDKKIIFKSQKAKTIVLSAVSDSAQRFGPSSSTITKLNQCNPGLLDLSTPVKDNTTMVCTPNRYSARCYDSPIPIQNSRVRILEDENRRREALIVTIYNIQLSWYFIELRENGAISCSSPALDDDFRPIHFAQHLFSLTL